MERHYILATVAATALILAGGAAFVMSQKPADDRFAACRQTAIAGGADSLGGDFTLTDETGARLSSQDLFKTPTLLYFGYTFCPDVCPLDNARNAEALDLLKDMGKTAQMAFISIDPKRDTPAALTDFTDAFHDRFIGLTGTPEEIADAARKWRVFYEAHEDGTDTYLVDHSTQTFLVLPKYGTVDVFSRSVDAETLAQKTACFMDAAQ